MRYEGNFESFKVEEQVALCTFISAHRATLEHFLAEALAGLKVGDFVKVLTSFKLDVLVRVLAPAALLQESELIEPVEHLLFRFLLSEPARELTGELSFLALELLVDFM